MVYLVYNQELLGPSDKSQAVLQKAEEVVPPAMYQFSQYVCEQTGLKIPQVPRAGSEAEAWQEEGVNSGIAFCLSLVLPVLLGLLCTGVCATLCLWRGLGLPDPSPLTSLFSPVSSQLPAPPKFNFNIRESWNSGRPWSLCLGGGPRSPSLALPTLLPGHAFPLLSLLLCVPPTI